MYKEDNGLDLLMKEILDGAREEVPAHIWDDMQADLDAIEEKRSRKLALVAWLRRGAIGMAAAAAVVLTVVFTGVFKKEEITVEDTLAVVTTKPDIIVEEETPVTMDVAVTDDVAKKSSTTTSQKPSRKLASTKEIKTSPKEEPGYLAVAVTTEKKTGTEPSSQPSTDNTTKENTTVEDTWSNIINDDFYAKDNADARARKKSSAVDLALTVNGNAGGSLNKAATGADIQGLPGNWTPNTIVEQTDYNFGVPMSFGLGLKIGFAKRWAVGVGVNYTLLTKTFGGIHVDGEGVPNQYDRIRNSQHYIGIPVNLYCNIINSNKIDFYAWAGGSVEKCIINSFKMKPGTTMKMPVKGMQYSAGLGLGVSFLLVDRLSLYIDPSIRYYFTDKNQPISLRTQNPLQFGCDIGFRINL